MKKIYSTPKLYKGEGKAKEWYVWFRYKGKLIKKRPDNRIQCLKERLRDAEELLSDVKEALKQGWNPLVPDIPETEASTYTLFQALEFAIEKKRPELDLKTISGYAGTVKFCRAAISELSLGNLSIQDTKRVHVKTVLETIKKQRKWSNKAYNKHLGHIHALLNELIQWEVIEKNPADNIKRLKVEDSHANRTPTPSEHKLIKELLQKKYPDFYAFIQVIFHTGIRPVEITKITFDMVDVQNRLIVLPPSITKSRKKGRIVPINDHLWEFLKPRFTTIYPKDYYLFGSYRPSGKGNIGLHKDFIPAPTKMKRDTATKRWEKAVKIGLGIDVNMYAMKHFGADMKILAGVPLDALQTLYGHQSRQMTEVYARQVKEVHKDVILKLSPGF